MKSTVLFVLILVIGALGGIVAAEIKPVFFDSNVSTTEAKSDTNTLATITKMKDDFNKKFKEMEEQLKAKDYEIKDLKEELKNSNDEKNETSKNVVSDNEEINNLQQQINELRGLIKAYQQNLNDSVLSEIQKREEEKAAAEEEAREQLQKERQEQAEKRRVEMVSSHTDRMTKELGLSNSQAISIKEALNQSSEKMTELFMNRENWNDRDGMRQKMEAIQKEWEDTAKSVLSTDQYNQFLEKNLNRVNPMGGGRFNRGGNTRPGGGR